MHPLFASAVVGVLACLATQASARIQDDADDLICPEIPAHARDAAQAGDPDAQFSIGLGLTDGLCGWEEAFIRDGLHWLERAAQQDHPLAAARLAVIYEEGVLIAESSAKALRFYEIAANGGHVPSQNRLGLLLVSSAKTLTQQEQGLFWLGAAADQGDGTAAAMIGLFYARGLHGVMRDDCLALDWYDASALLGAPVPLNDLRSEIPAAVALQC